MTVKAQLDLNGKRVQVEVDEDEPLLYVLREEFGLNGPKFGCGLQQCGSCMVLVDGEAVPSCIQPCKSFEGKKIETIEVLNTSNGLHPLQEAFFEEQAAQCGYCLNGMMIAGLGLLRSNPKPSDNEIREALQPVICRCGTHTRFIAAIKKATLKSTNF